MPRDGVLFIVTNTISKLKSIKDDENKEKENEEKGKRKVGDSIISPRRAGIRSRPIDPGKSARRHPQVVDARFWNEFQGFRLGQGLSISSVRKKAQANRRTIISER